MPCQGFLRHDRVAHGGQAGRRPGSESHDSRRACGSRARPRAHRPRSNAVPGCRPKKKEPSVRSFGNGRVFPKAPNSKGSSATRPQSNATCTGPSINSSVCSAGRAAAADRERERLERRWRLSLRSQDLPTRRRVQPRIPVADCGDTGVAISCFSLETAGPSRVPLLGSGRE